MKSHSIIPKLLQYVLVTFVFSSALSFVVADSAHAVSYSFPVTGGVITTTVDLSGNPPHAYPKNSQFRAFVTIESSSPLAEDVNFSYGHNAAPTIELVPPTSISSDMSTWIGYPTPMVFPTQQFIATSGCGTNCRVRFQTGIDYDPGVYVKITQTDYDSGDTWMPLLYNPQWLCGSWDNQNNTPVYGAWYPYVYTQERAEFFSDPGATIPLNVAGLNFRLKQSYPSPATGPGFSSSAPGYAQGYTPVLSGTFYDYEGAGYQNEYTDQYGPNSCDQQTFHRGFTTLEGGTVSPTPYTLIPQPPGDQIYLNATPSVYTGELATITWNAPTSTSCSGTNFSTGGAISGTEQVTINGDTTFTLTCQNISGSGTRSVTVADLGVYVPPQTCNGYPGTTIYCPAPGFCAADPAQIGYEICQQ